MKVVVDAGPLLLLEASGLLALLPRLYGAVVVPEVVAREVRSFDVRRLGWVTVEAVDPAALAEGGLSAMLDAGEAAVVEVACRAPAALVVLDDRAGRRAARARGLSVTGSVGVLLDGKRRGHLPAVRPGLEEFLRQGAWLSPMVVARALELAGE